MVQTCTFSECIAILILVVLCFVQGNNCSTLIVVLVQKRNSKIVGFTYFVGIETMQAKNQEEPWHQQETDRRFDIRNNNERTEQSLLAILAAITDDWTSHKFFIIQTKAVSFLL